eukprot:gene8892-biopygen12
MFIVVRYGAIAGLHGKHRGGGGGIVQGCQVLHGRWRTAGGLGGLAGSLADLADWRTFPGGLGLGGLVDSDLADSGGLWAGSGGLWRTLVVLAESGGLGGLRCNQFRQVPRQEFDSVSLPGELGPQ